MGGRRLGRTDLEVSAIGLGCMQFSGSGGLAARVFEPLAQDAVDGVVRAALDGGITWFDTAEMYGRGHSERTLAAALTAAGCRPGVGVGGREGGRGDVVVATKWAPIGRTAGHLRRSIGTRLECLAPYPIDLYQIHEPWTSLTTIPRQMAALAELVRGGQVRAVGVSNFTASQLRRAHDVLAGHGVPLASNQVRINLAYRKVERNGVLAAARELGVSLIAYSPLANGLLAGRFHDDRSSVGDLRPLRRIGQGGALGSRGLERSRPLVEELRKIAAAYGVTAAQVSLAWLTGYYGDVVVAIPGASKPRQATEAGGANDLRLTDAELRRLAELSAGLT